MLPHDWHLQPSRRSTWLRSCSYTRMEPQAGTFRSDPIHDAFSVTWCRNVRLSSPGRNLKNRKADCKRTSEFPFSRFAPARKSAQIISRQ